MKSKLVDFETFLKKLELVDINKFSSPDFKLINKDLEKQLNIFKEKIVLDKNSNLSFDDQLQIKDIIQKIEILEAKILPKAELINSFYEYSV